MCGAFIWKLSRRHGLYMVLTCKSYQDGMDYDNGLRLYGQIIKVTCIMHGAYMQKVSGIMATWTISGGYV